MDIHWKIKGNHWTSSENQLANIIKPLVIHREPLANHWGTIGKPLEIIRNRSGKQKEKYWKTLVNQKRTIGKPLENNWKSFDNNWKSQENH